MSNYPCPCIAHHDYPFLSTSTSHCHNRHLSPVPNENIIQPPYAHSICRYAELLRHGQNASYAGATVLTHLKLKSCTPPGQTLTPIYSHQPAAGPALQEFGDYVAASRLISRGPKQRSTRSMIRLLFAYQSIEEGIQAERIQEVLAKGCISRGGQRIAERAQALKESSRVLLGDMGGGLRH